MDACITVYACPHSVHSPLWSTFVLMVDACPHSQCTIATVEYVCPHSVQLPLWSMFVLIVDTCPHSVHSPLWSTFVLRVDACPHSVQLPLWSTVRSSSWWMLVLIVYNCHCGVLYLRPHGECLSS